MFFHHVWFAWKADATPDQISAACAALAAMAGRIPGVVSVSVGRNVTTRTSHTHGLLVVLEKEEDLAAYDAHEVHQEVVKTFIKPIIASVAALDYTHGVY